MRMAKLIANEIISYKVIPQSLPKIKFQHKLVELGRRRHRIRHFQNQYSINIIFLYSSVEKALKFSKGHFYMKLYCQENDIILIIVGVLIKSVF